MDFKKAFIDFFKTSKPPQRKPYPPRPRPVPSVKVPPPQPPEKKEEKSKETKLDPKKEFVRTFNKLTSSKSAWAVWNDFVTMSACAISNAFDIQNYRERKDLYLSIVKRYKKEELDLIAELLAHTTMALENNPKQDFLGSIYMEMNLGSNSKGQVFTPYHVAEVMAIMTLSDVGNQVKEKGFVTISDPTCGAGVMLIAAINVAHEILEKEKMNSQEHLMVVGQDLDQVVAMMCYIQISLLGAAGFVKVGNSLTEPIATGDNLKNYWFTPIYHLNAWRFRKD